MSPLNITQPSGIWSINVYNGYYKVMSNIPKMGHLPTPVHAWPKLCRVAVLRHWRGVASPPRRTAPPGSGRWGPAAPGARAAPPWRRAEAPRDVKRRNARWVCLKHQGYSKIQWLMIIIPMKNGYFIGNIPY